MALNQNSKVMVAKGVAKGLSAAAIISMIFLIIPQEGKVVNKQGIHIAYLDAVGVPTACYGQTGVDLHGRAIRPGMRYTEAECVEMLTHEVSKFEKRVDDLVKVPYASPFQKAGVLSFTYNVGVGNLQKSTLLKKLNSGNHPAACDELLDWLYAKGVALPGLKTRRSVERQWCLGNVPPDVRVTYSELMIEMIKQTSQKEEQ